MKKFNLFGNLGKRTRRLYGVLILLFALLSYSKTTYAQLSPCSLNARSTINVSVDENCEGKISISALLTDYGSSCDPDSTHYYVSLYDSDYNVIDDGTSTPGYATLPSGYAGQTVYGKVEYVDGNQTNLIPIDVFDKIPPTIACYDALSTYTGSITSSDPTYYRTNSSLTPPPTDCDVTNISVNYDILEFTVDAADTFKFHLDGSSAAGTAFFVALYDGTFDSDKPCENFLLDTYAGEGSSSGPNEGAGVEFEISLEELKDYTLVTTTVASGQTGEYTWTFSSTGDGVVLVENPDCEYTLNCYDNIEDKVIILGKDNCSNPTTVNIVNSETITNNCNNSPSLEDTILRIVHNVYQADDGFGNFSDTLPVNIVVNSIDPDTFASIIFPGDLLVSAGTSISCSQPGVPLLNNGNPNPDYTGWPTLNGENISGICTEPGCKLIVTYTDLLDPTCSTDCKKRIIRTWTISDASCNNLTPITRLQKIEIADLTAPVITCPASETINTNQFNCEATYTFPVPEMSDQCCDQLVWTISVMNDEGNPVAFVDTAETKSQVIRQLSPGTDTVTYTVYDKCGNSSECTFNVTVEDKVEPVAVCQTMTTISLTHDGEAQLPAYAVNSGSYDNCSTAALDYKIKRMDTTDDFADYVTFDCGDIAGNNWMVVLQVTDAAGNVGTCMVSVEVQDKLPPTITCPADQKVDCDYIYEPDSLTKYFGWPTAHDNCNVAITTDSSTVEKACYVNPVKVIKRYFTATDDGSRTDTCTQTINFVRSNYFGYDGDGLTNDTANGAITWPNDTTFTTCLDPGTADDPASTLHPNQTGWPVLNESSCDVVRGNNYVDQVFIDNDNNPDNNSSCFKIIRTWTVLDNCHRVKGKFVKWTHDQVIFVNNSVAPTIQATPDTSVCTYDATCTDGHIDLKYTCSDDCTTDENMKWRYYVDFDNDNAVGVWDYTSPIHSGNQLDASDDYPIGTHKILWQVWDQCGNSTVQEQLVTIVNCKKPTPICIANNVDLTDMAGGPSAMMEASMFDNGSNHTCGYRLIFSFSSDTTDKVKTYFCKDKGIQPVMMWVTAVLPDGSIVSQAYCVTKCEVQDNDDVCPDPIAYGTVSGRVLTGDDKDVEGVKIKLLNSEFTPVSTDAEGQYAFEGVEKNRSYTVEPSFNNDYLNGLSTMDLVMIQKHLLSIKKINSPFKLIAADANNDKRVSASDILILRKLILGTIDKINNSDAWRFIAKDYQFSNEAKAMAEDFPSSYKINNLTGDQKADFIAIKVGDLSGDARVNDEVEGRSSQSISFAIDDKAFAANDDVEIPVYANNTMDIQGFQTTVSFDADKLEFEGIESGAFDIDDNNFATNKLEKGYIPISWDNPDNMIVTNDQVLFVLKFKAIGAGSTAQVVFTSEVAKSEAYDSDYEVYNVELDYRNSQGSAFVLMQNTPNPFSNSTVIRFNNPDASAYEFNVYDLNGKLVYSTKGFAHKGMNTIDVDKANINVSGVLYYTVSTDKNTATRKMVMLK